MPIIDALSSGIPDSPYGSTHFVAPNNGKPAFLDQRIVDDTVGIGQGAWLRYQLQWLNIETSYTIGTGGKFVGVYDWSIFDDAVQKCNQAGVNMCWNIQSPPPWRATVDPATGRTLPGNGTTCNTTLTSAITNGVTPNPAGDGNAVISVVALGSGQSLTTGQQIDLDHNTKSKVESVLSTANYGAGATQIKVTAIDGGIWVPQNNHAGPTGNTAGASVINAGAVLEGAADTAQFAKVVATRYNGQSGHGLIPAIQIGNEEFDSSGPRDEQSKWLVPVINACYPVIKAVHPTCRVGAGAVRRTPKQGLAHVQAWMTNLFNYQGGVGSNVDWLDLHYYRGGSTAGPDPTTQDKDTPSIVTEILAIQAVATQAGYSPEIWCAETGWDVYDDGAGQLFTLATGVSPGGGPYTSLAFNQGASSLINGGNQVYVDYGNANQEIVYTWSNMPKGQTGVTLSTSSAQDTQRAWTPSQTHAVGAPVYLSGPPTVVTAAQYSTYLKAMYDGLRLNGASKCFIYTIQPHAVVAPYSNIHGGAGSSAVYSTETKSVTQVIGGTYTYLAPYTMTVNYAQKYPIWTSGGGGVQDQVLGGRFNLKSQLKNKKLGGRFNLQSGSFFRIRALTSRFNLLSQAQALFLVGRFNLQGLNTTRNRRLFSRYRLASSLQIRWVAARLKLLPGTTPPPPPDSLPSFFVPPVSLVRFGIGTYQSLAGGLATYGTFPSGPGVPTHPYAGTYGGSYGFILDTRIKQPQETQYTPAQEIGLDAAGVSVVRGYPQITWLYTTLRPDYWYYLQWLYRQSAKTPPGFQYQVLLQYPSNDGNNTAVQVLARMNPPTFSYRAVGAFFNVSLVFAYVGQAVLGSDAVVVVLS